MARDKLYGLSADVSFIDNALQLAASLRVNSAVPEDRPATSTTHDVQTQSASENIPAESLLARGSAMDLQSIQSGVRVLDEWDSPLTVEAAQYNNETSTKRRRLGAAENYDIEQQHGSDPQSLQQRLASRDIMPPPSRRLVKEGLSNASKQWLSGRCQSPIHPSMEPMDAYRQCLKPHSREQHHSYFPNPSPATSTIGPKSSLATTNRSPSRFIYGHRGNDGELDRAFLSSSHRSHPGDLSTNRLSLPPSTPSAFNYTTPRPNGRHIGISAHVRSSQPSFVTPESTRSSQPRFGHHNPGNFTQPTASPHFSNRALAPFNTMQRPYTKDRTFSPTSKAMVSDPRLSTPRLTSTSSAPRQFSWLTAPLGQSQHQGHQRSYGGELLDGSGAYQRPGGPRASTNESISMNSFSFTSQPQIGDGKVERRSSSSFPSHGRRPVRR